jgi:L-fuconolactonase
VTNTQAPVPLFGHTPMPDEAWLARAAAEPALEPELPIVDAHLHLWQRGEHRYFLEDYARDVSACGHRIEAAVAMECNAFYRQDGPEALRCVGETEFLAGMGAMADAGTHTRARAAAGIVAFADLSRGARVREVLEAHIEAGHGRVKGIRQAAKWDADPIARGPAGPGRAGLYLEPEFRDGLRVVSEMGLSFDASVFHPQIPELTALARAVPEAQIVLIHSGSPLGHAAYAGRETEVLAMWTAHMRELATCPNVSVKLGGILMCLGNFDYRAAALPPGSEQLAALWRPYVDGCLQIFGPQRCLASSNFPVDKAGFAYGTLWNHYKRATAQLSADERNAIFHGNARRIYRLPQPASGLATTAYKF